MWAHRKTGITGHLAIVAAVLIATPLAFYVGGYFVLSSRGPGLSARKPGFRFFASKWQCDLYQPAVRIEALVTGRQIVPEYSTAPPGSE
jgi:hypothetical protein